ncbi:hypothetical protein J4403_04065 [Candidatus Woesearchaeota archaeon]|nr:hypothetical protein [Candidatus Woesearchaeota archaeon]
MPHRCVKCGSYYEDGSAELLTGCKCGGKFFYFIRQEQFDNLKKEEDKIVNLSKDQKKQIEVDIREIIGDQDEDKPVILDFESIRVLEPGKFEIDLLHLFDGNPLIYKMDEGKYIIDIASSFQLMHNKKKAN